ncbi:MAG: hypothetical protein Q9221_002674 [Calogaya cf. arnoldii]
MGHDLWAWQRFDITKKIPDDQRLAKRKKSNSVPSNAEPQEKKRKKIQRPQLRLKNSLSNLHLLLRVPSFNRWPLAVRFLCSDVYEAWEEHIKRADGELRGGFRIFCDFPEPTVELALAAAASENKKSPTMPILEKIDVTYSGLKPQIAKSIALAAEKGAQDCSVCGDALDLPNSMFLVCQSEHCAAVSHMSCLAKKWLQDQPSPESLLPVSGACPQCTREHHWVDLVKEASIRGRGGKHLAKLIKEPPMQKSKVTKRSASSNDTNTVSKAGLPPKDLQVVLEDSFTDIDLLAADPEDDPLPDGWQELVDDDDNISVTSTESGIPSRSGSPQPLSKQPQKLEVVVEDSEWDSAEVLD